MRKLLDKSSTAQILDGSRLKGSLLFPLQVEYAISNWWSTEKFPSLGWQSSCESREITVRRNMRRESTGAVENRSGRGHRLEYGSKQMANGARRQPREHPLKRSLDGRFEIGVGVK